MPVREQFSNDSTTESRPAGTGAEPLGTVAGKSAEGTSLLDLLIERAPEFVNTRSLLPAFDWRTATAAHVQRLLERLADARRSMPAGLAASLLIAGHRLPSETVRQLPKGYWELAQLNALLPGGEVTEALRDALGAAARDGGVEAGIVTALVARLKALNCGPLACRLALAFQDTAPAAVRQVHRDLPGYLQNFPEVRIRTASFSTVQPFVQALTLALATSEQRAVIEEAPFGAVLSELLDPDAMVSDGLVILLDFEGAFPINWRRPAAAIRAGVEDQLEALTKALKTYAARSASRILINTLPAAAVPSAGHIDRTYETGTAALVELVNQRLAAIARDCPSIVLVDADAAMSAIAPGRRADPKLWYYGRIAYSEDATRALALAFSRLLSAAGRGPAKVLALDFDNTLWGGVVGDDGVANLECGDEFPGNAFKAFQQECLRLQGQGMLLVALSKNNPEAMEVFGQHPGMALSASDFAAAAINWEPKPSNIAKIAAALNLGLDSFVFLDDSPHEREAMRKLCPAVIVPEMPADPAQRPRWLRSLASTWPVRVTQEDARRSQMYAAERQAKDLLETSGSYEDYLAGLEQRLKVEPVTAGTLARAAQLHQRTNQFNLTTRRLTESDLAAVGKDPENALALVGTVIDKFGDHGITVAATARRAGPVAHIESFLMSCRVLNREIETAFLGALMKRLMLMGCEVIEGEYRPTAKNQIVREFYGNYRFRQTEASEGTVWQWRSNEAPLPATKYVSVIEEIQ